jgi:hypothetical protein
MKAIPRGGKIVVELYEADKRVLRKAAAILKFVERNTEEETAAQVCGMGREAIQDVLARHTEAPEVDTPGEAVKPEAAAA